MGYSRPSIMPSLSPESDYAPDSFLILDLDHVRGHCL